MLVNREKLLHTLESVSPGLTTKEFLEQSSCFVFSGGRVHTFNNEIACSAPSLLSDFRGAVTAKPLLELLSRLQDNELDIEPVKEDGADKPSKLGIRVGTDKRSFIRMEADVLLPIDAIEKPVEWKSLDKEFCEAVKIVHGCASTEENQFALTCVHISPDFLEACDRYQVARYPVKTPISEDILVRATSVSEISPFGMTEISETPSWLHFRNAAGLVVSCRRFKDSYRDMSAFVSDREDAIKVKLPGGLEEIISKTEIFSGESAVQKNVRVTLRDGKIKIKGEGASGSYEERKSVEYSGPPLDFYMNPKLLVSIGKKSLDCLLVKGRLVIDTLKYFYCSVTLAPDQLKPTAEPKKSKSKSDAA